MTIGEFFVIYERNHVAFLRDRVFPGARQTSKRRRMVILAGAGRILTIFSREQVGFLRFECLQIGQNAL